MVVGVDVASVVIVDDVSDFFAASVDNPVVSVEREFVTQETANAGAGGVFCSFAAESTKLIHYSFSTRMTKITRF